MRRLFVVLFMVILVIGCSNVGINKEEYNQRIKTVSMGMSKADFYKVFPDASPRAAKKYPGGSVDVLEINTAYYSFVPTGNRNRNPLTGMEGQAQWFYFYNDQLVQYGQPNDWPADPDKIIEIRQR